MLILGIETSCDETAAALVENGTKIVSSAVATSEALLAKYRGIVPDQAAREQLRTILPVIKEALGDLPVSAIDALAVTIGPGLIGSLLVGVETAKALAFAWQKPLIPVNHLQGHLYANWITASNLPLPNLPSSQPAFPALALVVSGGHTDLVLLKSHSQILPLGSTLDDAAGECFDKCGRLLDLPYPFGRYIDSLASSYHPPKNYHPLLPRPLLHSHSFSFSFSGLKTAFKNALENDTLTPAQLAFELQESITDILCQKILSAAQKFSPSSILIAGGVSANSRLRQKLQILITQKLPPVKLFTPPVSLCTDNATSIATCAFFQNHPLALEKIDAIPNLPISS